MNKYFGSATELDISSLTDKETMLIIAPHQDDESLGCGGTIALAKNAGLNVSVIFVTDGSQSHPGSEKYPNNKLVKLREDEAISALLLLGIKSSEVYFMRLPDGSLPFRAEPGFDNAVNSMLEMLIAINPRIIFLPWRRDPHHDHRATWEITASAIKSAGLNQVIFEYFIWLFERAGAGDLPEEQEGVLYYVDISSVVEVKKSAVMAHISQTTDLINDDQHGFKLSAAMLNHFDHPKEYFIQTTL